MWGKKRLVPTDRLVDPWGEALGEKSVDVNGCVFNIRRNVLVTGIAGGGRTNLQQEITSQIVHLVDLEKSPVFVFDTLGSVLPGLDTWGRFFPPHLQERIVYTDMDKLLEDLSSAVQDPETKQVFLTVTHTFNLTDTQLWKLVGWLERHRIGQRKTELPNVYLNITALYSGDSFRRVADLLRAAASHPLVMFEGVRGLTYFNDEAHQKMLGETPWWDYSASDVKSLFAGLNEPFGFVAFMTEYAGHGTEGLPSPKVAIVRPPRAVRQ